ncbi:MAG: hypothetical protein N2258_04420 [Brevinematales bacterium]|nr:hypothetical protein [Brevinematales bacterium]
MEEVKLPIFIQLAEKLLKVKYNYFTLDNSLILSEEAWQWIKKIKKEFYFYSKYKDKKFLRLRRLFFEKDYKKHQEKYPDLFNKESFNPVNFSMAVGGSGLEKNLFIGYFLKITDVKNGNYFTNSFGKPIVPIQINLQILTNVLEYYISTSLMPDGKIPEKIIFLSKYKEDIDNLINTCNFITELYELSKKEKSPFLRSGHILEFISGLNIFLSKFSKELIENGFATLVASDGKSILNIVEELKNIVSTALKCFVIDILQPLILSINYKVEISEDRVIFIDQNRYKKSIFERILDFFLPEVIENKEINVEFYETNIAKKNKEDIIKKERIYVDSENFIELLKLLKNFNNTLREDLEPEFDVNGKLLSLKQGFDQFDIPQNKRNIDPLRHTLTGKFSPKDFIDFNNNDEMVIKGVYWLYDRIQSIIDYNKINSEGIELEKAKSIVEDVRGLYFPSKNEYNEIRIYGTFSKFKIFLDRLFGSKLMQSKYHTMMKDILNCMDKCRIQIIKKEK